MFIACETKFLLNNAHSELHSEFKPHNVYLIIKVRSHHVYHNYHIFGTLFAEITISCICHKLFPVNWLPAYHDGYRKSCISNGERLTCLPRDVDDDRFKQEAWLHIQFMLVFCFTYIFVCLR